MRIISAFLIVLILLGLLAGCQQTTTYKEVSAANMRLEIPNSWQKTEDYQEQVENFYDEWGSADIEYFPIDVYKHLHGMKRNLAKKRYK